MSSCFEIEAVPEGQQVLAEENAQAENASAMLEQDLNIAPQADSASIKPFSMNATGMEEEMQGQFMQLATPALAQCITQAAHAH